MLVHDGAVPHADLVHVGSRPELFALKRRHREVRVVRVRDRGRAEVLGRELREIERMDRAEDEVKPCSVRSDREEGNCGGESRLVG